MASHAETYLRETALIAERLPHAEIERMAQELSDLPGTLYLVGLGGSAANCSHAAADFRNRTGVSAIALTDHCAEILARANDEGWDTIFAGQLLSLGAYSGCGLFVLSVGGGSDGVSTPLIAAIDKARKYGMKVFGIVGRDGGYTKQHGDCVIVVPTVSPERVTPHTEGWQMVILHCLVSHPALQTSRTKW